MNPAAALDHLQQGLPKERQKLTVAEVAAYFGCEEDHVYRLVKAGELRKAAENPIRIERQSAIDFRRRRQLPPKANGDLRFDAESFVPRTQRSFRVDQIAELFAVTVNHIANLIKQGEIVVPKERIDSAPSWPSMLVPRASIVDFIRRRSHGSPWWEKTHAKRRPQLSKRGQR